jgi:hypothetical protein
MDWTIIISSIGGSAVLFGSLAFLTRSIVVHFLDKDVENFKSALQLKAVEHQVRFNSLHAKRAEVIAEFYQKLLAADATLTSLKNSEDRSFTGKNKELVLHVITAVQAALVFFKRNELYFDDSLCVKAEKINLQIFGSAKFFMLLSMLSEQTRTNNADKVPQDRIQEIEEALFSKRKEIGAGIPELLKELKNQFRDLLGVPQAA